MLDSPGEAQALYKSGQDLWAQNKFSEAFQYFSRALALSKNKTAYLLDITDQLIKQQFFQQGIELFNQFSSDVASEEPLLLRLAQLYSFVNAPQKAIPILQPIFENKVSNDDAGLLLAKCYGDNNQVERLKAVLSTLMSEHSQSVKVHNRCAELYTNFEETKEALDAYQLSLDTKQYDSYVLSNIARLHQHLGNFEKAIEFNQLSLSLEPNNPTPYMGVSVSKKFTQNDTHIVDKFKEALELSLNKETIASIHFALGKIHDDLEDYECAFEHYCQANRHRQELIATKFDSRMFKRQFDTIKSYFTEDKLNQLQAKSSSSYSPIFVVGMPRSGTTLMERVFSENPNVFCAGELESLDLIPSHMVQSTGNKLGYPDILEHLPIQAMAFYSEHYLSTTTTKYKSYLHTLDKNPLNFVNIGLIMTLFPNAKVIHCKREPMDVCLSNYFQNFAHAKMNYSYDLDNIAELYTLYEELMVHWNKQNLNILDVQYKDLVEDTQNTLEELKQFTGLEQLQFPKKKEKTDSIKTASVWQARQGIYKSSLSRWHNYEKHLSSFIKRHPHLVTLPE